MVPIRFTSYTTPYDINLRDMPTERGSFPFSPPFISRETSIQTLSFYQFGCSQYAYIYIHSLLLLLLLLHLDLLEKSFVVPLEPRADLPSLSADHPNYAYYTYIRQLFEFQPVWDKRYLLLDVGRHFADVSTTAIQAAVTAVIPYICYLLMDGPFRNSWIRFGYSPMKDPNAWIYQYVEFRFSRKPQPISSSSSSSSSDMPSLSSSSPSANSHAAVLPLLYDLELNLHNRYPLCILRVRNIFNHHFNHHFFIKSIYYYYYYYY